MPCPEGLELELLVADHRRVNVFVSTTGNRAKCLACGHNTGRVPSRYERTVPEACRQLGMSDATFHRWKGRHGGMSYNEAKHLKELEKEDARLT